LADLKKEFNRRDKKTMKVVKLKKIEQESKTIEEFVEKFRKVARESKYERKLLVEKFKREMNEVIRQKLMESECLPGALSNSMSK